MGQLRRNAARDYGGIEGRILPGPSCAQEDLPETSASADMWASLVKNGLVERRQVRAVEPVITTRYDVVLFDDQQIFPKQKITVYYAFDNSS